MSHNIFVFFLHFIIINLVYFLFNCSHLQKYLWFLIFAMLLFKIKMLFLQI